MSLVIDAVSEDPVKKKPPARELVTRRSVSKRSAAGPEVHHRLTGKWGLLMVSLAIVVLASCGVELDEIPRLDLEEIAPTSLTIIRAQEARVETKEGREDAEQWGMLGRLYHAHGQLEPAALAYGNAARLTKSDGRWPYLLAHVRRTQGDVERAIEGLETALALQIEPAVPAHVWSARLLLEQGADQEAEDHVRSALELDAKSAPAMFLYGQIFAQRGRHEDAIAWYRRTLVEQPEASRVYTPLASSLRAVGEQTAAENALTMRGERAVALLDPFLSEVRDRAQSASALIERALEHRARGELSSAHRLLRQAVRVEPENAPAYLNLGAVAQGLGQVGEAETAFRRSLELSPSALGHLNLGIVLAARGDGEAAIQSYRAALSLDPNLPGALVNLGNTLARQGDCEQASQLFRRLEGLGTAGTASHRGLAHCALEQRFWGEASEILAEGLGLDPHDRALRVMSARLAASSPDPALRAPRRALTLATTLVQEASTVESLEVLARAHAASGNFEAAEERLLEALRLTEDQPDNAARLSSLRGVLGAIQSGRLPLLGD